MDVPKLFLYFFLLALPFAGGYIPEIESPIMDFSAHRGGLAICAVLFAWMAIQRKLKVRISWLVLAIFFFYLFTNLNKIIQDEINMPAMLNSILMLTFLLLIDNIDWKKEDLKIFANILIIIGIGTFLASAIQLTVDPYFYAGVNKEEVIEAVQHYALGNNLFRNQSLYRGIGANEAGMAIGFLFTFFLFMNLYKIRLIYAALALMMFFCGFVIFAKYVWLMLLVAILYFIKVKFPDKKYLVYFLAAIFVVATITMFWNEIQSSIIYKNRIATQTYKGRTQSTFIFFDKFFMAKPIFGYGVSSWGYKPYLDLYYIGIHVGHFEVLFMGGLLGFSLFTNFLYQFYRRHRRIFKITGNPIFLVFLVNYILINFTAPFTYLGYYGYMLALTYLALYYAVNVRQSTPNSTFKPERNSKSLVQAIPSY